MPNSLRARILNLYLARQQRRCLVRGKGNYIRAILSEDYALFDNKALLAALSGILPALEQRGIPHTIKSFYLDNYSFWLDITFPSLSRADLGGLEGGIRFGNSEVGLRSVSCYALVLRLICENGLMAWGEGERLFKRVHRGRFSAEGIAQSLSIAVHQALEQTDDLLDRLTAAASEIVPDIEAVIHRLVKRQNLTQEFRAAMTLALANEPQYYGSLFGLVNAMTQAAHLYQGDRRVQFEQKAARLLNWRDDPLFHEIVSASR